MNIPSIATSQQSMTNKLLVVGHPYSNLKFVVDVMQKCSVSPANKLQKEDIAAEEISKILLKAHGKDPGSIDEQVHVNPVWNGLAMDLMMSNLEHSKWVWADSSALPLLNYWKSIDNGIGFVLVYNSPQKALQEIIENTEFDIEEHLEQALQTWKNYNRAMLNFFYRNPECSLLVNSEQVEENSQKYLQEVGKQIGLNNEEIGKTVEILEEKKQNATKQSEIYEYLIAQLVGANESTRQLYMELESAANLPSLRYEKKSYSLEKILGSYVLEQKEKEELAKKLQQKNEKLQELQKQKTQEESSETKELENENKLLLEQLHLVQEELEKYYLENQDLKKRKHNPVQKQRNYGAAERVRQQLSYRLGAKMIENSKTLTRALGLPFALYAEVKKFREEKKTQKKLPPIHTYADAKDAERVKKHLSYRLGQAMIQSMKSPLGVFKLPSALKKAHREYKEERQ